MQCVSARQAITVETMMATNPEPAAYTAYVDLYGHYRALIAVVALRLGLSAEPLEADVEAWWVDHHEAIGSEGYDRLATMMGRRPPPTV